MAGYMDGDAPAHQKVTAGSDAHVAGGRSRVQSFDGTAGTVVGSGNVQINNFYGDQARTGVGIAPLAPEPETANSHHRGHASVSGAREDSGEVEAASRHVLPPAVPQPIRLAEKLIRACKDGGSAGTGARPGLILNEHGPEMVADVHWELSRLQDDNHDDAATIGKVIDELGHAVARADHEQFDAFMTKRSSHWAG